MLQNRRRTKFVASAVCTILAAIGFALLILFRPDRPNATQHSTVSEPAPSNSVRDIVTSTGIGARENVDSTNSPSRSRTGVDAAARKIINFTIQFVDNLENKPIPNLDVALEALSSGPLVNPTKEFIPVASEKTNKDGSVTFSAEAGRSHIARVHCYSNPEATDSYAIIPPFLHDGTDHLLVIAVPNLIDTPFRGRVSRTEDRSEIRNATIQLLESSYNFFTSLQHSTTNANGIFSIFSQESTDELFYISAPGRATMPYRFSRVSNSDENSTSHKFELPEGASLTFKLLNAPQRLNGYKMTLSEKIYTKRRGPYHPHADDTLTFWKTDSDTGSFTFDGLLPEFPICYELEFDRSMVRSEEISKLAPSEHRVITIDFDEAAKIDVFAQDQFGNPITKAEVQLFRNIEEAQFEESVSYCYVDPSHLGDAFRRATLDANGKCKIIDVPKGFYWIGAANIFPMHSPLDGPQQLSTRAVPIVMDGVGERREEILTIHRGLYISGMVRSAKGEPKANANIQWMCAWSETGRSLGSGRGTSNGDGTFTIGPFSPGPICIFAELPPDRPSAYVFTEAPAKNIDLQLVPTGIIEVFVRGTDGKPANANIVCTPVPAARSKLHYSAAKHKSTHPVSELFIQDIASLYNIVAFTENESASLENVALTEADISKVYLYLAPVATLTIQLPPDLANVMIALSRNKTPLTTLILEPRETKYVFNVPPGQVNINVRDIIEEKGFVFEKTIFLKSGESMTVDCSNK
ncbi:MAG: hypothetical protein ACKVS6_10355 [Planctomycetota bacterium]